MQLSMEKKRKFIINVLFYAICLFLGVFLIKYVIIWFLPLIIGFIVGIAIHKPIKWFAKKTGFGNRVFSVIFVLLLISILSLIVIFLCNVLLNGLVLLAQRLPDRIESSLTVIREKFKHVVVWLNNNMPDNWGGNISAIAERLTQDIENLSVSFSSKIMNSLIKFTTTCLPGVFVTFAVTLVSIFFISMDYDKISSFVKRQIPNKAMSYLIDIKNFFCKTIVSIVRAYLILMVITFIQLYIGLILLKTQNAFTIAILIALLDALPIIGTGTVLIPWAIICFLTDNIFFGIGLIVLYLVIIVVHNMLEPKLIGKSLGLHPLVTLTMMYLGLKTLGFIGLFLGPLLAIFLKKTHDQGKIKLWK